MTKSKTITVKGTEITVIKQYNDDYISLTDMVKGFGDDTMIYSWMRNRNTVDVYKNEFINSSISFMNGSASEPEYDKLKLQKGDVLVTKDSETPQDIAVPALVNEDLNNVVCGYHLALIRPHNKLSGSYLLRLFQTKPINAHFEVSANGITRYGLGVDSFTNLRVYIPPIQEQHTIASYLYEQTQTIDKLIVNKTAQVARLKELRQIEINNAVTKGLNPNAPLKDSGIKWLGEIPEHWEVKRLKNVAEVVLGKMLQNDDTGSDNLKPYLRSFNVQWERVDLSDVKEMWFSENEIQQYRLMKFDIVVSEGGDVGRAAMWLDEIEECYIQNSVHKVTCRKKITPYYLLYEFSMLGKAGFFETIINKVSIGHLTREKLVACHFLVPPLDEQLQIANHLQQRTASIDKLINNTEAQIEKLQELRKITIYEAVTGKVKCHA